ncbi:uncharacterized protein VTP21DRAFT_7571 [Calcarisporiella thermophila]|uniref:uncharacterized protein n=1 Tax=Calcarisporiella thermophila TaxID=911321 RepID=UPI00374479D1
MASYFDDFNIKQQTKKKNSPASTLNPDLSEFMSFGSSNAFASGSLDEEGRRFLSVANMFSSFRQQLQDENQQQFLDDLITQLLEESTATSKGPPPTSKSFIRQLPTVPMDKVDREASCAICTENFHANKGTRVTRLPCEHRFDRDCIVPWLELHNTCPSCRYVLPSVEDEKKELEEFENQDFMYG